MPALEVVEGGAGVTAAKGFLAAGVAAGLKASGNPDMALVYSEKPAGVAAVFTTNLAAAAPVIVSRRHAASGKAHGVVVNSGGANACTGAQGLEDAEAMAAAAAAALGVDAEHMLVCSTGLIGSLLPMDKVLAGIETAAAALSPDDAGAARAIMTTDTVPKSASINHRDGWSLGGIAKGAGMISPDMATMLAFVTTDAAAPPELLRKLLKPAVDVSFNSVTVDGDTSTNDTLLLFANGASGVTPPEEDLAEALEAVCRSLARQMVADGEGATKLVSVRVRGAKSEQEAKQAARTMADSLLVKTMVYGGDANWGRLAGAVGRAGVAVDFGAYSVEICGVPLVIDGVPQGEAAVEQARIEMKGREVSIGFDLASGKASAEILTCDLTPGYVTFNAEYEL